MFTTKGNTILKDGETYQIHGYNLGNWMNLERFMFGFPGVDHLFRRYLRQFGGDEKYHAFFDRYYRVYFQEEDAAFLEKIGCNTLRIPFNYRLFEKDSDPFKYDDTPFLYIDNVINLCKEHHIAVILDYHSAQGFQSEGHCGDNISGEMPFYYDKQDQERYIALWKYIAKRYKDEESILGYDLLNEPTPRKGEEVVLCDVYRRVIDSVRSVDPNHIVMIEGTGASYDFSMMTERFDENMVFTPHLYIMMDKYFASSDRAWRKKMVLDVVEKQNEVAKQLNVPVYYGETGLSLGPHADDRLDYLDICLEVFNEKGYGWTVWTYKDIWRMGLVSQKDDSPWWNLVRPMFNMKMRYGLDSHANAAKPYAKELFKMIEEDFDTKESGFGYYSSRAGIIENSVWINIVNALGKMIAPDFAQLFANLGNEQMQKTVDSFAFENCVVKENWYAVIAKNIH